MTKEPKAKKKWYKRWWAITIWIFLGLAFLGILFGEEPAPSEQAQQTQPSQANVEKQEATQPQTTKSDEVKKTTTTTKTQTTTKPYDLELTLDEVISLFEGLSEIQQEAKFEELKGKRIKTSIRADKIDEATLSSQLVVLQMSDLFSCTAKAFFPKEQRNDLLQVNLGDTITFSGEFVDYKFGFASCIEFSKSKLLEIEKGKEGYKGEYREAKDELDELKEKIKERSDANSKIDECADVCAGEDSNIPAVRSAFWTSCYEIYTYAGEEELDQMIADCK